VSSSWLNFVGGCKSRLSAICRSLFLSRQRLREKVQKLQRRLDESEQAAERARAEAEAALAEAQRAAARIAELEQTLQRERTDRSSFALPEDLPLPRHQYGPRMIALCVNLARRVGLRPAAAVLKIFFLGWAFR
jgi:hypothetical protein